MTNEEAARILLDSFSQFRQLAKFHVHCPHLKPRDIGLLYSLRAARENGFHSIRITELSDRMKVTPPSVTQMVTSLETEGMVIRKMDPEDRRSVLVSLTGKGEEVSRQMYQTILCRLTGLVDYLGQEKSLAFSQTLDEIMEYFSRELK